jgi:uncharacterized membrane protein YccC
MLRSISKKLNKEVMLHALRLVIATMIAAVIGKMMNVGHLYWLMFTVVLVLESEVGSSLKRSAQRISGTLIGVPIALVLITIVGSSSNVTLFVLLTMAMVLVFLYEERNYMLVVMFVTIAVLLGFVLLGIQNISQVALERIFDTLLGTLIAVVVARLIAPTRVSHHLMHDLQKFLRLSGKKFVLLTQEFKTTQGKQVWRRNHNTYLNLGKKIVKELDEAVWESNFFSSSNITSEFKLVMIRQTMFLSDRFLEMTTLPEKSSEFDDEMYQSLLSFAQQVEKTFMVLSQAASAKKVEGLEIDVSALRAMLESKVDALTLILKDHEHRKVPWNNLLKTSAYYENSIDIIQSISDIAKVLHVRFK